jgi:DNA-binding CsgD family transcriptional regulator
MPASPVEVAVVFQPATLHQVLPALGAWCGLTSRERQVLALAVEGLAAKQIAHRLLCSVLTINDHLSAIYRKTRTHSRDQLLSLLS